MPLLIEKIEIFLLSLIKQQRFFLDLLSCMNLKSKKRSQPHQMFVASDAV